MNIAPPASSSATRGTRRVQSVDHALDILDCISQAGSSVGVSDIARHTGLSKATVHHLLTTLETRRVIIRDPHGASYRLGWALYEWGQQVAAGPDVARVARPYLDELAVATGESVLLGIRDGDSVLYLDRGDARSGFRMVATAGMRSLLHSNASGKILLAAEDPQTVEAYLTDELQRFTPHTITDRDRLLAELARVRAGGVATCWQERELGLCSIAVPIRNHESRTVAALTIAGPAGRVTPDAVVAYVKPLRAAAAQIEAQLGAPSAPDLQEAGNHDDSTGH